MFRFAALRLGGWNDLGPLLRLLHLHGVALQGLRL